MRIYRLEEASEKKARFINNHPSLGDEQKDYLLKLYLKPEVPDNIIDWQKIKDLSFDELKSIAEEYLKNREEKKNKKNLSRALEGRDYIKVFEKTNEEGTEYLYLPLTWLGSKYLASDHFLPKIKVPSEQMDARDFSDNTAKNDDLSPGAKWCISLWTIPDCVIEKEDEYRYWSEPLVDLDGKELRHEGKRYWLDYTSGGYYFLFYFRDYDNLDDIDKKIALTLRQGSPKIEDITLADDYRGEENLDIEMIQYYWDEHYQEYESEIENIQVVSEEDRPKFREYEKQKEEKAREYYNSHRKEYILKDYFTYNESTGKYDSNISLDKDTLEYLVKNGEFIVPLGSINGDFDCSELELKTLKNGPTEVEGNFDCSRNNLITLEGAPKKVGGGFYCDNNDLTSLEGAPRKIEGYFECYGNRLTTLEYAPKYIGGGFNCSVNNLTTLEGAPKEVRGYFVCATNNLTTLEGAPQKVGGFFDCSNNQLKTLEGAPKEIWGDFFCWRNSLQSKELSTEVRGDVYYNR